MNNCWWGCQNRTALEKCILQSYMMTHKVQLKTKALSTHVFHLVSEERQKIIRSKEEDRQWIQLLVYLLLPFCFIFSISLLSPWYSCNGWRGIKHQVTYLVSLFWHQTKTMCWKRLCFQGMTITFFPTFPW